MSKSTFYLILWLFLTSGLLVLNQYRSLTATVLYGIVPGSLLFVLLVERRIHFDNRTIYFLLAFTGWSSLSVFYTVNMEMTISYLSKLLGGLIVWYIVTRVVSNVHNHKILIVSIIIAIIYQAIQALFIPTQINDYSGSGRATGLFDNPNSLGFVMWYGATSMVLFLLKFVKGRLWQLICIGLLGVFIFVLIQSGSRKSATALFVFILVLFFFLVKSHYRTGLIRLGLILLIGYFVIDLNQLEQTALFSRASSEHVESSGEQRLLLIQIGLQMFLSFPIFGVGMGSFVNYSSLGLYAHNDFIEVLASTGIIGFSLYITIYWIYFKECRKLLKNDETYIVGAWSMAFLAGFLALGMGRPTFLDPVAMMVLAFFSSLVLNQNIKVKRGKRYFY